MKARTVAIAVALGTDVDSPTEDKKQLGAVGKTGRHR